MEQQHKRWGIIGLLGLSVLLGACGGEEPQARPSISATPSAPTTVPTPTPDEFSTLIAMQAAATDVPTVTPWPTHTPTAAPTLTPTPTLTATPSPEPATLSASTTPIPTNTPRSTQVAPETPEPAAVAMFGENVPLQDHYILARPFPRDPTNAIRDYASRSYPFGTTGGGQYNTHHGVDIQNPQGIAILAAGSGWVIHAGSDAEEMFGPQKNFYGNLVVIEHDFPAPNGQMLYTLYGHMSEVAVEEGQHVNQGDKIGQVGATGVALGAHLHFEVRLGDPYDYESVYNPDLWLRPWPTYGTLAGRVFDQGGNRVYNVMISIEPADGSGPPRYTFSYADDGVQSDPYYGEHFTYGDLPEGEYEVFVRTRNALRFKTTVYVEAGQTTWVDIVLN